MGGILAKVFGTAAAPMIDSVGNLLDKLTTSDKEKLDARTQLAAIERQFNVDLMVADTEFAKSQENVITAEAKSESWMARSWRPILMLTFTFIIAWNYVIVPIALAFTARLNPAVIPLEMWSILKLGVSGYVIGRSVEKTAAIALPILTAKINT